MAKIHAGCLLKPLIGFIPLTIIGLMAISNLQLNSYLSIGFYSGLYLMIYSTVIWVLIMTQQERSYLISKIRR